MKLKRCLSTAVENNTFKSGLQDDLWTAARKMPSHSSRQKAFQQLKICLSTSVKKFLLNAAEKMP